MKPYARALTVAMGLLLVACTATGGQPTQGPSVENQAATIVAGTMNAIVTAAAGSAPVTTPFASPSMPTATPAGKPALFINSDNARCRGGPGPDYEVVATFTAGTTVDLVGQDTADNFWIVTDPVSHQLCWVAVQDATPTGNYQSLPQITPPAPSVKVPARPGSLSYNYFCDNTSLTVSLSWADTADNENGYRVFRNGNQIAELAANSTTFEEKIDYTIGTAETYSVIAYNEAGASAARSTPTFSCQ